MRERAEHWPGSLSATATHDTKRGEDARARLLALTEDAGPWMRSVERWREMHAGRVAELDGGPAPEPETEWLIYQALLGVWPEGLSPRDGQGLAALRQRFLGFVEKALREAKLRTRWTQSDDAYEQAVADYAAGLIAPGNEAFLSDFVATTLPLRQAGRLNSLTQTLVKLTAPGIPDIYQGSEAGDFSLVDPDNRRPVDFEDLAALLSGEDEGSWRAQKLRLIAKLLGERRKQPDLFRLGSFMPLEVSGEKRSHVVAFARSREGARAIVVAPRLAMDLLDDGRIPADAWADTAVDIPAQPGGAAFRDCLSGEHFEADAGTLPLRTLLQRRGMACLVNWP